MLRARESVSHRHQRAAWQRCRTHFMRNTLCRMPKSAQPFVATLIRTIFVQPDAKEVAAQLTRVAGQLENRFPDVAAMLEEAGPGITAYSTFPTARGVIRLRGGACRTA
ncbi:MAG: transposase [Coriobacteriia bacterium]